MASWIESDTHVRLAVGRWCQLRHLGLQLGERAYWQNVYVTQKEMFGPVNLIANGFPKQDSPRFWAVDLPANPQAWRREHKRFWIEPTCRDWKSYGFDLESTQIDDPQRLQVILLGIALATLWMIHLGDWVIQHGHRHLLDRTSEPDFSLFRIG